MLQNRPFLKDAEIGFVEMNSVRMISCIFNIQAYNLANICERHYFKPAVCLMGTVSVSPSQDSVRYCPKVCANTKPAEQVLRDQVDVV